MLSDISTSTLHNHFISSIAIIKTLTKNSFKQHDHLRKINPKLCGLNGKDMVTLSLQVRLMNYSAFTCRWEALKSAAEQHCVCWICPPQHLTEASAFRLFKMWSLLSCSWSSSSSPDPPAFYLHVLCPRCCQMLRESWRRFFVQFSCSGRWPGLGDPAAWPRPTHEKINKKVWYSWLVKSWKWLLKFGIQQL